MALRAATLSVLDPASQDVVPTTAGIVAMRNMQAQIHGLGWRGGVHARADLVGLYLLRGELLGRIADYERADASAEQLVRTAPVEPDAWCARARARATFHRFQDALTDLDAALRWGADPTSVDAERASIFQAVGRYDEALAIHRSAVERHEDFHSLGGLATLYAECGDVSAAERTFSKSRSRYRGVSPIPLAQLDLQRGHMWVREGDLERARLWFEDVVARLPAYAPAQGHLAEAMAALGDNGGAIARLRPLTRSSDDPDYPAQLARILREVGREEEADEWRARAAARYDELVALHLEAFADHGAEFWLAAGDDPHRALWLARQNLAIRPTRRARALVARAAASRHGATHPD